MSPHRPPDPCDHPDCLDIAQFGIGGQWASGALQQLVTCLAHTAWGVDALRALDGSGELPEWIAAYQLHHELSARPQVLTEQPRGGTL